MLVGGCCIAGKLKTILVKENPTYCGMGNSGMLCCAITTPCVLFGPFPMHPVMSILSICWRQEIVTKYNIDDGNCGCCLAMLYPCSMFQMYVSLSEWESEEMAKLSISQSEVYIPPAPMTYRVPLPPAAVPGSTIVVELPGGRRVSVQVPMDTKPGQMLEIMV